MSDDDAARRQKVLRKLYQATALCSCFLVVEVTGGLISHSLAILSDAAHLLADLASFMVAIAASYLASLPATRQHTFGLKRTESLAALFSMASLAFVSIGLAFEAIRRLVHPPEESVDGALMSGVAAIGVLVNVILAFVLGEDHVHMPGAHDHDHACSGGHDHGHPHVHSDEEEPKAEASCSKNHSHDDHGHDETHSHGHHGHETDGLIAGSNGHAHKCETFDGIHIDEVPAVSHDKRNINLHAAYLHVMADLAQSVAVLIGGLVIWAKPEWDMIDPILTLGFCVLVLYSALGVLRSAIAVLLEETPPSISWQQVYDAISNVPNVSNVHDLHIWSISHGQPALSVHCNSSDSQALSNIHNVGIRFGVAHATIQVQTTDGSCISCEDPFKMESTCVGG